MNIKIMSDLHMEFGSPSPDFYADKKSIYTAFVIAGDISNCNSPEILKDLAIYIAPKPLIYVAGNHDYYHSSKQEADERLTQLEKTISNFYFLNRDVLKIKNFYFVGCTGWQNIKDYNYTDYHLNDFRLIKDHPSNVKQWGENDNSFLENTLKQLQGKKVIVITHIPPISKAVDKTSDYFIGADKMADAYHNNYDDMIIKYSPLVWIHGHMHDAYDEIFYNTRIVRNPYGYHTYSERKNKSFNKHKIIKVN